MELLFTLIVSYLVISFSIMLFVTINLIYKDIKDGDDFKLSDFLMLIFILLFSWYVVWWYLSETKIFSKLMSFTLIKGNK